MRLLYSLLVAQIFAVVAKAEEGLSNQAIVDFLAAKGGILSGLNLRARYCYSIDLLPGDQLLRKGLYLSDSLELGPPPTGNFEEEVYFPWMIGAMGRRHQEIDVRLSIDSASRYHAKGANPYGIPFEEIYDGSTYLKVDRELGVANSSASTWRDFPLIPDLFYKIPPTKGFGYFQAEFADQRGVRPEAYLAKALETGEMEVEESSEKYVIHFVIPKSRIVGERVISQTGRFVISKLPTFSLTEFWISRHFSDLSPEQGRQIKGQYLNHKEMIPDVSAPHEMQFTHSNSLANIVGAEKARAIAKMEPQLLPFWAQNQFHHKVSIHDLEITTAQELSDDLNWEKD